MQPNRRPTIRPKERFHMAIIAASPDWDGNLPGEPWTFSRFLDFCNQHGITVSNRLAAALFSKDLDLLWKHYARWIVRFQKPRVAKMSLSPVSVSGDLSDEVLFERIFQSLSYHRLWRCINVYRVQVGKLLSRVQKRMRSPRGSVQEAIEQLEHYLMFGAPVLPPRDHWIDQVWRDPYLRAWYGIGDELDEDWISCMDQIRGIQWIMTYGQEHRNPKLSEYNGSMCQCHLGEGRFISIHGHCFPDQ